MVVRGQNVEVCNRQSTDHVVSGWMSGRNHRWFFGNRRGNRGATHASIRRWLFPGLRSGDGRHTCSGLPLLVAAVDQGLRRRFSDPGLALPVSVGALIGANIGAILNKGTTSRWVETIFGLTFVYVAVKFNLSFFEVAR